MLTVVFPKGRLLPLATALWSAAGWPVPVFDGRALTSQPGGSGARFVVARPADVPTYVERGAADLGIVGKDVLLEVEAGVLEVLDLGFGRCRFVLAAPRGWRPTGGRVVVATKYPRVAVRALAARGFSVDCVRLQGSVELAPALGLAEAVVDLVATGRTLAAAGLEEILDLGRVTARLVANPVGYRLRSDVLGPVIARLAAAAEAVPEELPPADPADEGGEGSRCAG